MKKKIFITLFLAVFANITGVGIVVPLLPVYAENLGASGIYIALIFGSFSISRTFLLPVFGKLSDLKGRKPFIIWGLFAYFLVSIAFVFSDSVSTLILIRFFHGCASAMLMPVVQAYIGDITQDGKESFTMGLFNISMFTSLSLGPLLGGFINEKFSLDTAFLSMGGLALFAFFLGIVFLPKVEKEKKYSKAEREYRFSELYNSRHFFGLVVFRFVYTTSIGIIWCFIPVYASVKFGMDSALIGILVMGGVFTSGVLHAPMGFIGDRIDKRTMVVVGGIICAVGMYLTGKGDDFSSILQAIIIFGIGGGIAMPSVMGLAVVYGKSRNAMGGIISLLTVAHSLGMLAGSLLAGVIMDYTELESAFPTGAAILVAGTLIFISLSIISPASKEV